MRKLAALLLLIAPTLFAQSVNGIANQTVVGNSAFVAGSGAANVLTACPTPAITAQAVTTAGFVIHVRPNAANTTTTPTFNLCSLGAVTVVKGSGGALIALAAGDYATGVDATFYYTGSFWQLMNPQTSSCPTCTITIASGTSALGTAAIASGACATVVTTTATGTASTDAITWNPNASIKAVTGYVPSTSGGLTIAMYPTANAVNTDVCNWTASSITPGAVTLNWRVVR